MIYWEHLNQRCVQILSKDSQMLLIHRCPSEQKPEKASFHYICSHLSFPRHWCVQNNWFRDVYKTWAKTAKGSLFTGAQASKSRKKLLFTTSGVIFHFRDIDILRTFETEMWRNLEQTQPKAPCSQALKQAKAGKRTFSTNLWASSKSQTLICWESLVQRYAQNLSKDGQRLLVHRRSSKQKSEKAPFQHISEHLPNHVIDILRKFD